MARKRLIWQLFPSYLVLILFALFGVTWYATRSLRTFYHDEAAADLHARALLLERQALGLVTAGDAGAVDALCKELGQRSGTRITVITPSGAVLGDSDEDPARMENHASPGRPEMLAALAGKQGLSTRFSHTLGKDMMYLAVPLKADGTVVGVVRTSIPVTSIDDALERVYASLTTAGVVIAAFAGIVGLLVARRITQPMKGTLSSSALATMR